MSTAPTGPAPFAERRPAAAESPIETARASLDGALLALREIVDPGLAVPAVEVRVAEALRGCYVALAQRSDYHGYRSAVDGAVEATRAAMAALQESPTLDRAGERALGLAAAALGALLAAGSLPASAASNLDLPAGGSGGTGPAFIPATIDAPAVVAAPRGVLTPAVSLPPPAAPPPPPEPVVVPPPPITTLAALEALRAAAQARLEDFDDPPPLPPAPAPALRPPAAQPTRELDARAVAEQIGEPPLDESTLVFDRARNCLEELAGLGNMRRPMPGEPWAAPRTERRLLARVDAIVACGEAVLPGLVKQLEGRPLPDPELTWALLFLFGSLAGDDAADQVIRLVMSTDLEAPDMMLFVADALALAPSPALERPLRAWLDAARPPALRAVALTALGRRRRLSFVEGASAALDEGADRRVVLAATRALAFASGGVDANALDRLLRHDDVEVTRAALVSALRLRCRLALERARALTAEGRGDFADAALFLAVAGEPDSWPVLEAAARAGQSPVVLDALGWFGSPRAVDLLLDVLGGGDEAGRAAAAAALYRLTGFALTDDDKEPPAPAEGPVLGGEFTAPARVAQLTTKAEIWSAWWAPHRRQADPLRRYRFGHLWSAEDDLWELDDDQSGAGERTLALVELAARAGAEVPLDLEDFVSRQRAHIAELRAQAQRHGGRAGEWPTRLSR